MLSDLAAAVRHALAVSGSMGWSMLWALILGFALSGVIESVVRKGTITRLMGGDDAGSVARAAGIGAASSSCSYAAVALARSLFRKGANFTAAMVFEVGSTNLVIELGIILALLMGWQFTLADIVGGLVMITVLAVLYRRVLSPHLVEAAKEQADRGLAGRMEGHAEMDMGIDEDGSLPHRLASKPGRQAVSRLFVMNWAAVWTDIALGLLIAGAAAAWVPDAFWRDLFLVDNPTLAPLWGPLVGPIVAILSFVCSVGNVPLAAVLWNGGISFGGVVSFLLADLIVLPVLLIYRKYYGTRMALFLLGTFYAAMVVAGYVVELIFGAASLVPEHRNAKVLEASISWNYTTFLNIAALALAALLVISFIRQGAWGMLREMGGDPSANDDNQCDPATVA